MKRRTFGGRGSEWLGSTEVVRERTQPSPLATGNCMNCGSTRSAAKNRVRDLLCSSTMRPSRRNRIGIQPVGVFQPVEQPVEEIRPVYVLLPHASLESVIAITQCLLADAEIRRR